MELSTIKSKIYEIRGYKVILDFDIAELYGIETKRLKEAVRRNANRFPNDFMFELSENEFNVLLRTQIASSNKGRGGIRYRPFAFTEQGVAMLSSVLNTEKAIEVNISIVRAFIFVRQMALENNELLEKLGLLENKYDRQFSDVYEALNFLLSKDKKQTEQKERRKIGYLP
ncbi:MAG: ORF6N domain-containing protein [Bacteroidia bacterium]|nr:ORF6N domain-containing protein [Bacteroidia bacterium]